MFYVWELRSKNENFPGKANTTPVTTVNLEKEVNNIEKKYLKNGKIVSEEAIVKT